MGVLEKIDKGMNFMNSKQWKKQDNNQIQYDNNKHSHYRKNIVVTILGAPMIFCVTTTLFTACGNMIELGDTEVLDNTQNTGAYRDVNEYREDSNYGVVIGFVPKSTDILTSSELSTLNYKEIVIDAEYFTSQQIEQLHENGQKVYSYINVGSLENFRDYYDEFSDITLGEYENWDEESWIDVSQSSWQKYVVEDIAKALATKGIDGFFVDNLDVYCIYETEEIYDGLCDILKGLAKYNLSVIVNGGDMFVTRYIEDNGTASDIITGVNQESVFANMEFTDSTGDSEMSATVANDSDEFVYDSQKYRETIQDTDTTNYYKEYLNKCKKDGLLVYLLEYTTDESLIKTIHDYCTQNDFKYFISSSLKLEE